MTHRCDDHEKFLDDPFLKGFWNFGPGGPYGPAGH